MDGLTTFTAAYIAALLWSTNDPDDETPLDDHFYGRPNEFDPATLEKIKADCDKFLTDNAEDIKDLEEAGHDFALSRNGHGSGFFDRDNLSKPSRDRLQTAAENFGEFQLYVGDDGKLYAM